MRHRRDDDPPETGVCRTCRRGIFHDGNTWLHDYRAAGFNHPAEPRVDPQGPHSAAARPPGSRSPRSVVTT